MNIIKNKYNIAAAILLCVTVVLSIASMRGDAATMDELAHIPSGYSYLKYADYRLNPEHPPLAKDIATLPLVFMDLNFPTDKPLWTEYRSVYGDAQWDAGRAFLYESGNDPDTVVFWSHWGPLLMTVIFGIYIFKAVSEWFGKRAGIIALFFYALSPTVIAHGHLVTTDIAAAAGIFIATYYYLRFLKKPDFKNILWAGIAFGIALLLKFSTVLIIPFFGILVLVKFLQNVGEGILASFKTYILGTFLVGVVGVVALFPIYFHHTYNYPPDRQRADADTILQSFAQGPDPEWKACTLSSDVSFVRKKRCLANMTVWASDKPMLRAYAQYALGVLMVTQRAVGGNTTYFLGEVSRLGWHEYFPIVYVLKEPIALHILTIVAAALALFSIFRKKRAKQDSEQKTPLSRWQKFWNFFGSTYLVETALLLFIAIYWGISIKSNLNIGVRHLIPTFPLIYALVARQTDQLLTRAKGGKFYFAVAFAVAALLLFQTISVISVYPSFLSYFNELVGTDNGYKYVVDSNYDWGQDLKRLKTFVEKNNIQKIGINYFGAGDIGYYFGEKGVPWWSAKGPEDLEWFAISATFLQGSRGAPDEEMLVSFGEKKYEDTYWWLPDPDRPYARAGKSIFIYKLK